MSIVLKHLSEAADDIAQLQRFYNGLYVAGFPDANERESLANMIRYLQLRAQGWYEANNYHIILALDGDRAVAASVSDYFAIPNCGIIEFLLVDEALRGTGVGKALHDATLDAFNADARRNGKDGVDAVVIELNDPFRVPAQDDNYDPFDRAMIWDRWGYGRLCFPYVQPALSEDQEPVRCLVLAMKPLTPQLQHEAPAAVVADVLRGFLRWAMRIDDPDADPIFIAMREFLSAAATIRIEPLSVYVGRVADKPLFVRPITSATDPAFRAATDLYARAFPPGPTVIDARMFRHALTWTAGRTDMHYHLWGLALAADAPISGMASFFVMPRFGFGGYLAFEAPLRGSGRARIALKRLEEQLIRDEPEAQRWYAECRPDSREEAAFLGLGLSRVPVRYFQPPAIDEMTFGTGPGPELTLLIKNSGADYGQTPLSRDDFLDDLKTWLVEVYRIADPEATCTFTMAQATFGGGET